MRAPDHSQSRLWRSISTLLSGRVAAGLLQVAFIALLARSLGVENYGRYVAFLAGVYLGMNLFDFGFGTRLLRLSAEDDARSTTTWMFLIRTSTNLLVVVVGSLLWHLTAPEELPLLLGVAVVVFATGDTFGDLGQAHLLGRGRVHVSAAMLVGRRLASLVPFVTGLSLHQGTAGLLVAGGSGYLVAFLAMRDSFGRPRRFRAFVSSGTAYWGLAGVANLQQADTILVSAVAGPTVAGLYGAATRLLSPLNLVNSVLQQVYVPRLSATTSLRERRDQWQTLYRTTVGICVLMALGSLASPLVVDLLFGREFGDAWPVLAAVCFAAAFNALSQTYLAWLYAQGVRARLSLAAGGVIVLGLAALAVLCWQFGVAGAAVALVLPYLLLTLLYRGVSSSSRATSAVAVRDGEAAA